MRYLFFVSLFIVLYYDFGCDTNKISNVSFITLKAEGGHSNPLMFTNNYDQINESLNNCLEELFQLKEELKELEVSLRTCKLEHDQLKKNSEIKEKVVSDTKKDLKKYCGKKPVFDELTCTKLREALSDSIKSFNAARHDAYQKERQCLGIEKNISIQKARIADKEEECSKIEITLSKSGLNHDLRVVEGNPLLDKPLSSINRSDEPHLLQLLEQLMRSLEQCLEELGLLSYSYGKLKAELDFTAASGSSKTTKGKGKGKHKTQDGDVGKGKRKHLGTLFKFFKTVKKTEASVSSTGHTSDEEFRSRLAGLESAIYTKDLECRRLETDIKKASERLEASRKETVREEGCFRGLTSRFMRTIRKRFGRR
ncbi:hypothetical protein FG386_002424 [Cryptosporidium ryanae]|uniref:uncharacterized protein n=1 Tax=Cryptosporidium ryanae TaxID=515981 RepID=UPI00351A4A81|nr:hypothetical protein FG386_002424 [Cryptosporidium ryanae]